VFSTAELIRRIRDEVAAGATVLALHESATERLADMELAHAKSLLLLVGPEGGIAEDEMAALSDAGAAAVRLGPQVLRTSTAAAVALGALGVLTARWDQPGDVPANGLSQRVRDTGASSSTLLNTDQPGPSA
jgi:16S rRNA (uracil1498-N3)-methyltransferase